MNPVLCFMVPQAGQRIVLSDGRLGRVVRASRWWGRFELEADDGLRLELWDWEFRIAHMVSVVSMGTPKPKEIRIGRRVRHRIGEGTVLGFRDEIRRGALLVAFGPKRCQRAIVESAECEPLE